MVLVSNIIVTLVCSSTTLKSLSSNIMHKQQTRSSWISSFLRSHPSKRRYPCNFMDRSLIQARKTHHTKYLVLDAWSQRRLQLRPATNHAKYACMLSEAFQEQQEFTSSDLWTIYRKHAECYLSCNLLCYTIYSVRQEFSLPHLKT